MSLSDYSLCSLSSLQDFMGITGFKNAGMLERCINRATALFEAVTRRKLAARDYSYDSDSDDYDADNAILDGTGRNELVLPQYPINSLSTLRIDTLEIDERSGVFDTGWVLDKQNGIIRLQGLVFSPGYKNIDIAYNAGFSTIPDDLAEAAMEQAAWFFKQSAPGGNLLGVSAKNLADGSISYTARDLLPGVKPVLETYKKRFTV